MTPEQQLARINEEIRKRLAVFPTFVDTGFPLQQRLVEQSLRFQAWQATRRAAKSNSFARRMLRRLTRKRCNALYLALTLDSAKAILWDVVDELLRSHNVEFNPNKQAGTFTLANGSFIKFAGLDSNFKEMRKILGQKYAIVGIDECGSMTQDMQTIVDQMITPALIDEGGDLILLGTAENIPGTYFEKVTSGKVPGWHVEKWDTYQNPYMAEKWKQEIERIMDVNPLAKDASWFKTHYLNQWCTDDDLRILTIAPCYVWARMPELRRPHYVIGCDLGWKDATSFVVTAYHRNDPTLYVVRSFKQAEMDLTDVAQTLKKLAAEYPGQIIIDGAAKQSVEEMRKRHMLHLTNAEKTEKSMFLRMLNDDLIQGRMIFSQDNKQLLEEAEQLMWLKGTDEEDPRCQNHLTDALLYAWRYARAYIEKPEVVEWKSSDEKAKQRELDEAKRAQEERDTMMFLY